MILSIKYVSKARAKSVDGSFFNKLLCISATGQRQGGEKEIDATDGQTK